MAKYKIYFNTARASLWANMPNGNVQILQQLVLHASLITYLLSQFTNLVFKTFNFVQVVIVLFGLGGIKLTPQFLFEIC